MMECRLHLRPWPTPAPSVPTNADDWLQVGKVVGVQGLKGELRINPASEFPERFIEPEPAGSKHGVQAPKRWS